MMVEVEGYSLTKSDNEVAVVFSYMEATIGKWLVDTISCNNHYKLVYNHFLIAFFIISSWDIIKM